MSLHCDLQSFLMKHWIMMMHHYGKFSYRRFRHSEHVFQMNILNLWCDSDFEHSNPIFSQDTSAYDHEPLLAKGSAVKNITETVIFWLKWALTPANQSFCMKLWLMIMHHHTKFGYEKLRDSDDIIQTNGQTDKWFQPPPPPLNTCTHKWSIQEYKSGYHTLHWYIHHIYIWNNDGIIFNKIQEEKQSKSEEIHVDSV